jgi:hypothetical protein
MKSVLFFLIFSLAATAGGFLHMKGQILRIESGNVIVKTDEGEKSIPVKNLTKEDAQTVKKEAGSKNVITLKIPTQSFEKK